MGEKWGTGRTHTHMHTHRDNMIHVLIQVLYSPIGHGAKIHLLLQHMNNFICFPLWTKEEYHQSLLHVCPAQSRLFFLLSVSLFQSRSPLLVNASSCLLNISGISAGGLIKKQLPLVATGDALPERSLAGLANSLKQSFCEVQTQNSCRLEGELTVLFIIAN